MKFRIGLMFAWFVLWAQAVTAREVPVKEVTLSLFNKPVNGYRLMLSRGEKQVSAQILKHVAGFTSTPAFQYERTIIYENIRYSPIISSREISLYYLLRSINEESSEMTLVAMYDYKRAISSREFPELAQRLLADLSTLLKKLCGDVVQLGTVVYDDKRIAQVMKGDITPADPETQVQVLPEEETERHGVLVQGGMPGEESGGRDSAALAARVKELEAREKVLQDREESLKGQVREFENRREALERKAASGNALRDTIADLKSKIFDLQMQMLTADGVGSGDGGNAQVAALNGRLADTENRLRTEKRRADSLALENDRLRADIAQARALTEKQQRDQRSLQEERDQLQAALARTPAPVAGQAPASDSLVQQLQRLELRTEQLKNGIGQLQAENARLRSQLEEAQRTQETNAITIARLEAENYSLKSQASQPAAQAGSMPADSVQRMKQRLAVLESQNRDAADLRRQNAEKDELLKQQNARLKELLQVTEGMKAENQRLTTTNDTLTASLRTSVDALKQLNTRYGQLITQVEMYEARVKQMEKERLAQASGGEGSTVENRMLRDSLNRQAATFQRKESLLKQELARQRAQIDSLALRGATQSEQQSFIREQWAKLESWSRELNQKSTDLSAREKLLNQQQSAMALREKEFEALEAKYRNLNDWESRLKMQEQQLKQQGGVPAPGGGTPATRTPLDTGPWDMSLERVTVQAQEIPCFRIHSRLSYRAAQEQAVSYLLSLGYLLENKNPDLIFQGVLVGSLSPRPLTVRISISTEAGGTAIRVSFREPDGTWLAETSRVAANAFIQNMMKFTWVNNQR